MVPGTTLAPRTTHVRVKGRLAVNKGNLEYMLLNEGFTGSDQDSKMGVILMFYTGRMDPSNRVYTRTRRENSAQLHRYPAQSSTYKSTLVDGGAPGYVATHP